ncbi:glycosyltransferase [Marinobacter sp.]|uniref:glycosyltransferase n=1 Tax=Marinobacter sp. TaxID=50741 RepID=UPI0035C66554
MKKILHLSHTDIRSDSRILKEIEAAVHDGYVAHGIGIELSEGSKNVDLQGASIQTLRLCSKALTFLPKFLRHFLTFVELFVRSVVRSIRIRPDIIHSNDTLVLPIAVVVKMFTRARLVYDAHELESDRNGLSKPLGALTKLIEKMCWPFVDGLIVVSPSIQAWYSDNIGEKRSEVILNSPSFKEVPESGSGYLRDRFDIPDNEPIFLYVGILGAGRGIDLILNAFKDIVGAHVVFLGYGDYSEKLRQCARECKNIHVHEAVEHEKVVEVASSADVGLCLVQNVSLSDYFCLPNKLFEYAFAGLPVLASDFPDIRKVVQDHDLGRCVELTEEGIQDGVAWFLQHRSELSPGKNLKPLSWQRQQEKLLAFYDNINR